MRRRSGTSTLTKSCSLSSCLPPLPVRLKRCTGVSWIVLQRLLLPFSLLFSLLPPFLLLASPRRFSARALRLILFLSSSSLPSPSPALLVSLYTVFIIAVPGFWLKICPPRQTRTFTKRFNEWWEWTTRCTAATQAVGTTFPALLQGRRLKGLINFGGSIWFAMESVVAVQWRVGHTASVRHSESLADRSTFPQDWSALA